MNMELKYRGRSADHAIFETQDGNFISVKTQAGSQPVQDSDRPFHRFSFPDEDLWELETVASNPFSAPLTHSVIPLPMLNEALDSWFKRLYLLPNACFNGTEEQLATISERVSEPQ